MKEIENHKETKEWHEVIAMYAQKSKYRVAIDIGTAMGLSAYTIAMNGTGKILSFDIKGQQNAKKIAKENGYTDRIVFFNEGSARWRLCGEVKTKVQLIIVDGDHSTEGVLLDAVLYWKYLDIGGYMIFDDYKHPKLQKDVGRACDWFMDNYLDTDEFERDCVNGKLILKKI